MRWRVAGSMDVSKPMEPGGSSFARLVQSGDGPPYWEKSHILVEEYVSQGLRDVVSDSRVCGCSSYGTFLKFGLFSQRGILSSSITFSTFYLEYRLSK